MQNIISKSIGAILLAGALITVNSNVARASEETTTTTTTSAGTISEFGPEWIVIKTTSSSDPLRYSSTKTTTYVDEAGRQVSVETVKSGLPVTVYYTKVGDKMVASKVIVRKAIVVPPAVVEEKKTTKTTTTTEE